MASGVTETCAEAILAADCFHFPLLARALDFAGTAIFITDTSDNIVWANHAYTRLSGYSAEEVIGSTAALLHGQNTPNRYRTIWQSAAGCGDASRGESTNTRKDGSSYIADEIVTPLLDESGAISHFVVILHDVTQSKKALLQERALANQDVLTGLACRAHMLELVQDAITAAQQSRHTLALLFIDLDGFKAVNDTHGHHIGDLVLKAVAARLQSAVRCSDSVARFGGDEFVILLPTILRRGVAMRLGRKIVQLASQPCAIGTERHALSASVGIAFYPDHGCTCDALLISADQAMYRAKRNGGNRCRLAGPVTAPRHPARCRPDELPELRSQHILFRDSRC